MTNTTTTVSKKSTEMTKLEKLTHEIKSFLGLEEKTLHYYAGSGAVFHSEAGKDTVCVKSATPSDRYDTFEQIKKPAKAKLSSPTLSVMRSIKVRLVKGFRISLLIPVLLIALRHFVPEVADSMPHVYQFIDTVMLPIVDWGYALLCKAVQWIMSQGWFSAIINALKEVAM